MKIGIISLGLIGGSILKALSGKGHELVVISQTAGTIEKAKNYTPFATSNLDGLRDCELVFVCSPISKTIEILDKLENIVSPNAIVTDVASVKEFVMQKERPYVFIGSHPMAGTENSGFEASFKELFEGAKWVITPKENEKRENIEILSKIIASTGADSIVANATEHDRAVALISHMPLILSQALFKTTQNEHLAQKLASSGFRDMTRLAMSNTTMANDMVNYNGENIKKALSLVFENTKIIDTAEYEEIIKDIKTAREKMYSKDGKNIL